MAKPAGATRELPARSPVENETKNDDVPVTPTVDGTHAPSTKDSAVNATALAMFALSFSLVLFELLLTRIFGIVLFAQFAHLALSLALLGISIGAVLQHLWPQLVPEKGFEERLALLGLLQGASMILAILAALHFPVTVQGDTAPTMFQERSVIIDELLNMNWFLLLLPVLVVPFTFAGLAFAGAFQRRKEHIGKLYGADLVGGGVSAVLFIPLLASLAGPDVVFVAFLATSLSAIALYRARGAQRPMQIAVGLSAAAGILTLIGFTGTEVLKVKTAAGYSESNVSYTEWTALTRLAIHEDKRGLYMLLDNTSASEIIRTPEEAARKTDEINRSVVYELHPPGAKIAILAASAGPEVAVARHYGHEDIEAIDIAGEIADIVAEKYPDAPANPYTPSTTKRVKADARAAILHSPEKYDVIQMVHANLHSNAGLLANAWSPALLETKEAFSLYLRRLKKTGTLSFGKGHYTSSIARAAAAALEEMGVREPWRHIAYVRSDSQVLLIKKRPWTVEQRDLLVEILARHGRNEPLYLDPTAPPTPRTIHMLYGGVVMTDDHPYVDTWKDVKEALDAQWERVKTTKDDKEGETAIAALYRSVVVQCFFAIVAGFLFLFVPLFRRGPVGLVGVRRYGVGLVYVACLGYGYLALETVLIHELVLFVGHPTYAVTVVILSMLLSSGAGSVVAGRVPEDKVVRVLTSALGVVVVLGILQAFVFAEWLRENALGLPVWMRVAITGVMLSPLGLVMGMGFPLCLRIIPASAAGMVPWAWALNGWMSVVASLSTVLVSRLFSYSAAYGVALFAYVVAMLLAPTLPSIGRTVKYVDDDTGAGSAH